jgi:hypothetical protein
MTATINITLNIKEYKDSIQRLWNSNQRDVMDVAPSFEHCRVISSHALQFVMRLAQFFIAKLKNAQCSADVDNSASCLQEFTVLALTKRDKIRLWLGRCELTLLHDDFCNEFNQFDLQGKESTAEYIRRDSFGAFLYHLSTEALTSLAVGMRLAVYVLWKEQESDQPLTTTTKALVDQHLDGSQLIPRFVRVQPQVQMMDIKTGLVNKFVTIKVRYVKLLHYVT